MTTNTGGQQPSRPDEQETAAQAGGSIRDRLTHADGGHGPAGSGDSRASGLHDSGFRNTDSQAELASHGRDQNQYHEDHAPEAAEDLAGRHYPLDEHDAKIAERKVSALFLLSLLGVIGFVVTFFAVDQTFGKPGNTYYTPLLGLFMAIALGGIGAGAVLWAKLLMVDEEAVQERHPFGSEPDERGATAKALRAGLEETGIGRRPLLRNTLLLGAGSLAVLPLPWLIHLGPFAHKERKLNHTAWAKGVRLIRTNGTPVKLGDLQLGGVESVFPDVEGGTRMPDAPTLLIRMREDQLKVPADRADWVYQGHIAYSSICTHLGCPVKLYEQQTHHLFCPCHQSTFAADKGAKVLFGPAARALPQLAISVDSEGYFVAQGDYNEPIGPSFWERSS